MKKIKVLFVAAELTPLAKVGGLADVIGALPKALEKIGVDVRLIIPKYGIVDEKKYPLKKIADGLKVPFNGTEENFDLYETPLPDSQVPVYLIDSQKYLGQNGVYFEKDASPGGSNREAERFTFLSRASLAVFEALGWQPEIIHCHDWHVGMVPIIAKILGEKNKKFKAIKTLLTIHNLEYQGWYRTEEIFKILGVSEKDYPTLSKQRGGSISSLEQAILTADYLNTVSPAYAEEIMTPEYGAGLEETLHQRKKDLVGILNGIDVDRFDPSRDDNIAARYTAENLAGKEKCKADLQKICGLPVDKNIPLLGIVSRLAGQKGVELIYDIAEELNRAKVQFVCLGTGDPALEKMMAEISEKYPDKIYTKIGFDAKFAQQIYAGADLFLMPSKFEPCGLGQMIAMRYGTLPIVRATGGLKDTVSDYHPENGDGDGFVFEKYDSQRLLEAVKRALELFKNREKWYTVVRRIMKKDFSWTASARKYLELYNKIK